MTTTAELYELSNQIDDLYRARQDDEANALERQFSELCDELGLNAISVSAEADRQRKLQQALLANDFTFKSGPARTGRTYGICTGPRNWAAK